MGITEALISSRHFTLERVLDKYQPEVRLLDTSLNGTYVNGKPAVRGAPLRLGLFDEIALLNPQCKESVSYMFINYDEWQRERAEKGPMNDYEIGRFVGYGTFSTVREVVHLQSHKVFAMKIVDSRRIALNRAMLVNEYEILKTLQHPNVVRLYDMFVTPNRLYFVFDLSPRRV